VCVCVCDIRSLRDNDLTLILLTWRRWWANNASKSRWDSIQRLKR